MAVRAAEREGKRHSISLRVTADVRQSLERAASAAGRSMTQEAELRLEQSFLRSHFHEQAGILADVVSVAVTQSARVVCDDPLVTHKEARYTFRRVMLALRRLSIGLGVPSIESISEPSLREEAVRIEAMADRDDAEESAARDRWSTTFGAWSRLFAETAGSPEQAARKLQERLAAEAGLTIMDPPRK